MKNILLIATGGTIASSQSDNGLTPAIDVNRLVSYVPKINQICNLDCISIMNVDSSNMSPELMADIADSIADNYSRYDGFVITHGTDTMAYTAAGLSYMISNLTKPVILTGSQLPIEADNTDAIDNLYNAFLCACDDFKGIYIAFNGKLISGTHAMKIRTVGFDAFISVNAPYAALIDNGTITKCSDTAKSDVMRSSSDILPLTVDTRLYSDIMVLKIFPGMRTDIMDYVKSHYKGVIIESYGIGGIPNSGSDMISKIHELTDAGIAVVITTQCLYEGINLNVYEVGHTLAKQAVINGGDMTTEALVMKLMWALAHFDTLDKIKEYIESQTL